MAAPAGPDFRWALVLRRSRYNRRTNAKGEVELYEHSTRRQEVALGGHIKTNNMGRVVAVYKDVASAYKEGAKRPEYEAALSDLRAGRFDGIAVWRLDRLVRRTSQYRYVLDVLEESGGRLYSMVEGIDTAAEGTSKAITNIILTILVTLAEMEAEATSARTILMHEDRAKSGFVQRNKERPFGHTDDWTALVPQEAELIRELAERILAKRIPRGDGYLTIAKDWTRRGIKTSTGRDVWDHTSIRRIIQSPRLIGKREYGGSLFDLEGVPPILDENTWRRVQDVLENRSYQIGRRESRLASNIAVCGVCTSNIVGAADKGSRTYVCRKDKVRPNACGGVNAVARYVDAVISEKVIAFLADSTRVAALLRKHAPGPEMEKLHQREQELSDSLLALDQALKPPPGIPRMDIERYWTLVAEIDAERREIHRRLAISREASLLAEALEFGDKAAAEWAKRPLQWQRAILRLVTERIELHKATKGARPGQYGSIFDPNRVKVTFAV